MQHPVPRNQLRPFAVPTWSSWSRQRVRNILYHGINYGHSLYPPGPAGPGRGYATSCTTESTTAIRCTHLVQLVQAEGTQHPVPRNQLRPFAVPTWSSWSRQRVRNILYHGISYGHSLYPPGPAGPGRGCATSCTTESTTAIRCTHLVQLVEAEAHDGVHVARALVGVHGRLPLPRRLARARVLAQQLGESHLIGP
jgi:hypothetical protein